MPPFSDLRPTWAEINLDNIAFNLRGVRQLTGRPVMAVVKANAYGHGAREVARTVLEEGASFLGVAVVEEGIELRRAGISAPILILGATLPQQAALVVQHDLRATVFSFPLAEALSRASIALGKPALVHVKVDTGMGRIGLIPLEVPEFIMQMSRLPGLIFEGLFTHFSSADEADKSYTQKQLFLLEGVLKELRTRGIRPPLVHAANSAALLDFPPSYLDLVRLGISLYGYYPSREVRREIPLKPALTWKSTIVHLKKVPVGTPISYGRTYQTAGMEVIASLPVGYADGYSRALSNRGQVLVRGCRARVVGRVCMDQTMVRLDHLPDAAVGDEVVLLGTQGQETIEADEMAAWQDTISYEILCGIGRRVPRIYIKKGKPEPAKRYQDDETLTLM
ncbi:MAG: alanine racemase [Firmicutes bacterium]|nr:alanine racemase [Bacillota bacterium]MCL5039692.1 alanine racemase [Bacillota bacterium]